MDKMDMRRSGVVIKTEGETAIVRVRRECACGHQSACSAVCFAGESSMFVESKAVNRVNATEGDIVEIETDSKIVLAYAALIFIAPLAVGMISFFIADSLQGGWVPYAVSGGCFSAVFGLSAYFMNRNAAKNNRIFITRIIAKNPEAI